jgi:hypothetical protein
MTDELRLAEEIAAMHASSESMVLAVLGASHVADTGHELDLLLTPGEGWSCQRCYPT